MAKKRYHQSLKDRRHERRGEERHLAHVRKDRRDERMGMEKYWEDHAHHLDPRRDKHRSKHGSYRDDYATIHEDRNAVANLPQRVMYEYYPKNEYNYYDLNDDIRGIDVQMNDDVRQSRRNKGQKYPEKY